MIKCVDFADFIIAGKDHYLMTNFITYYFLLKVPIENIRSLFIRVKCTRKNGLLPVKDVIYHIKEGLRIFILFLYIFIISQKLTNIQTYTDKHE